MMTMKLLQKDYMHLATCLVPIGDQIGMTQQEIADMLQTKTRRFTEDEIRQKFHQAAQPAPRSNASKLPVWSRLLVAIRNVCGLAPSSVMEADLNSTTRKTK